MKSSSATSFPRCADMTEAEFSDCRALLGLTQAGLADALESDIRTVRRWENGERAIPGPVRVALRLMLQGPPRA
jgi:DNA-binding transcriptional regulator YiaG